MGGAGWLWLGRRSGCRSGRTRTKLGWLSRLFEVDLSTLYVVATPIGNLEDVTSRALRVLGEVGLIAAEDTRTTRKLLNRYGIKGRLVSFHEHNRKARAPRILEALRTGDVALVSEAGAPGVSDPGRELVQLAREEGHTVTPVPGASAVTTAISASGMAGQSFLFLGFLPRTKKARGRALAEAAVSAHTLVLYEAPHRIRQTLEEALHALGDRKITVCRELTKLYEEIFHGSISEAVGRFGEPRGEFTLVIEGRGTEEAPRDEGQVRRELLGLREEGARAREAVATVVEATGLPRRYVYQQWLALGREG